MDERDNSEDDERGKKITSEGQIYFKENGEKTI